MPAGPPGRAPERTTTDELALTLKIVRERDGPRQWSTHPPGTGGAQSGLGPVEVLSVRNSDQAPRPRIRSIASDV